MAVQRALCGAATALNGQEVRVCLPLEYYEHNVGNLALEVVGQIWSSEVISLFLKDREVGRVAQSCHISMDLLCQEMRERRVGRAQSRWVPLFRVVQSAKEGRRRCSDSQFPSFNVRPGLQAGYRF